MEDRIQKDAEAVCSSYFFFSEFDLRYHKGHYKDRSNYNELEYAKTSISIPIYPEFILYIK